MKLVTLLENTSVTPELEARHGISFYIETEDKKILFDAGPDNTFLQNASKLGVDLSAVDVMVLSHGHYDHGGGIAAFLQINKQAKVIMKETAVNDFLVKKFGILKFNIGLKLSRLNSERFTFITGNHQVAENIHIITGFEKTGFIPSGNESLLTRNSQGQVVTDSFDHEICLLLTSNDKNILLTGCSHSGLGNMMRSVKAETGVERIDTVIGGFHLFNPATNQTESQETINVLMEELNAFPETQFYTGHCTGNEAYRYLKSQLGDRISEFKTGIELVL